MAAKKKTSVKKDEVVEETQETVEETADEQIESINQEELKQIYDLKNKALQLTEQANKAVGSAKIADLEANNFIMQVFLKYGINQSTDQIMQDGTILRGTSEA